jgi:hypothetical protein
MHPLDDLVTDFGVGLVPPPHQHVGAVEQVVGQPVLAVVQGHRPHGDRGGC